MFVHLPDDARLVNTPDTARSGPVAPISTAGRDAGTVRSEPQYVMKDTNGLMLHKL